MTLKPASWAEHFKGRSRAQAQEPTFNGFFDSALDYTLGTNNHTAHELSDLLAAKKSEIDDIVKHVSKVNANTDPSWAAWSTDWGNFMAAWQRVYADAQHVVDSDRSGLLGLGQYETDKYNAVLNFLQPQGPGSSVVQALYNRYTSLPKASPIPFRPVPQPAQTYLDMQYVSLDRAAQEMPRFVKAGVGLFTPGLVPKTADQKNYDPGKFASGVLKEHWKALAIGSAGLLVGLKLWSKVAL
jgi:hypothetical protein